MLKSTGVRTPAACVSRSTALRLRPAAATPRTCVEHSGRALDRLIGGTLAGVAAGILLSAAPVSANEVLVGAPRVVDGDTLVVAGTKIRLFGIDAPEKAQLCKSRAGADYQCGMESKQALTDHIGSKQVACEVKNTDLYGRSVSICRLEGREDLNAWLVQNGHAVAYKQYSTAYEPLQQAAQAAGKGIWQGPFQVPAEWRKAQKQSDGPSLDSMNKSALTASAPAALSLASAASTNSQQPPSPQCNIKGNISQSKERVYHVPGGRSYDATLIDTAAGERWFCSTAEAEAAGWRAAKA